jgi:predicted nuclease with TOPRIM domain
MTITESIKFDKLQAENEALKKELTEKDKEINSFKQQIDMVHNFNQNLCSEIEELKQQQLYKEDFNETIFDSYILKDNSKYDKLPSKDMK